MAKGLNYYSFRERYRINRIIRPVRDKHGNIEYARIRANPAALAESVGVLEAAVQAKPDDWVCWYTLGDLYEQLGEFAKSVIAAEKCYELRPTDPRSAYALATNLRRLTHAKYVGDHRYIEARRGVESELGAEGYASPFNPDASQGALHELGMTLDQAVERCLVLFGKVLALGVRGEDKNHVEETLGVLYTEFPQLEDRVSSTRPASELVARGTALAARGLLDDAIQQFAEAVQLNPNLAEAHFDLGGALLQKGRHSECIPRFREALRLGLEEFEAEAHYSLGVALRFEGQADHAVVEFKKAVGFRPSFYEAHYGLAEAYNQQGLLDRSIDEYQISLRLRPNLPEPRLGLGTALRRKGLLDEAIECYQHGLQVSPDYAPLHQCLAVALHQARRLDEAIAEFRQTLRLAPEYEHFAGIHLSFALALHEKGLLDEAIGEYKKGLRIEPGAADVHPFLTKALQGRRLAHEEIW